VLITAYKTPDRGPAVISRERPAFAAARNNKILDAAELPSFNPLLFSFGHIHLLSVFFLLKPLPKH